MSQIHVTRVGAAGVFGHDIGHCDPSGCSADEQYYGELDASECERGTVVDLPARKGAAKARLSAAAPELLAACVGILREWDRQTTKRDKRHPLTEFAEPDYIAAVRAAVNKATGGEK